MNSIEIVISQNITIFTTLYLKLTLQCLISSSYLFLCNSRVNSLLLFLPFLPLLTKFKSPLSLKLPLKSTCKAAAFAPNPRRDLSAVKLSFFPNHASFFLSKSNTFPENLISHVFTTVLKIQTKISSGLFPCCFVLDASRPKEKNICFPFRMKQSVSSQSKVTCPFLFTPSF